MVAWTAWTNLVTIICIASVTSPSAVTATASSSSAAFAASLPSCRISTRSSFRRTPRRPYYLLSSGGGSPFDRSISSAQLPAQKMEDPENSERVRSNQGERATANSAAIRSIHEPVEYYLKVDEKTVPTPMATVDSNGSEVRSDVRSERQTQAITLWYRTWGNPSGIPVLFVHGGPGNCVEHYHDINADFFDEEKFFVVEVDQRGTGKSTPTTQDLTPATVVVEGNPRGANEGVRNMRFYRDVSIQRMSADFEEVRAELKIERWLVFGGSWGSTLGLDYAERYPRACLGLILRGIFLSTEEEMDDVFTLRAIEKLADKEQNERYVGEFKTFFEVADAEWKRAKERNGGRAENEKEEVLFGGKSFIGKTPSDSPSLLPDDAPGILQIYDHLIMLGDREATWKFFVFENNLMEEDETQLIDPEVIGEDRYSEAQSVSFFEARLFLKGVYETGKDDFDLLRDVEKLSGKQSGVRVPTWVVQGTGDAVCPEQYAHKLVGKLKEEGVLMNSYFVDAGHKASSRGIHDKLIEVVEEFRRGYVREEGRA